MDFEAAIRNMTKSDTLLLGDPKLRILFGLADHSLSFAGDLAEVGVYRGGVCRMLKRLVDQSGFEKTVHAFDTFAGIPNAGPQDLHRNGDFADTGRTADRLRQVAILVHEGVFPETVTDLDADSRFCFTHFDGDTYQSCTDFLDYFWPRLTTGGVMVLDDYGWRLCPGVKEVSDAFFRDRPERLVQLTENQAVVIKQP